MNHGRRPVFLAPRDSTLGIFSLVVDRQRLLGEAPTGFERIDVHRCVTSSLGRREHRCEIDAATLADKELSSLEPELVPIQLGRGANRYLESSFAVRRSARPVSSAEGALARPDRECLRSLVRRKGQLYVSAVASALE